MPNLPDHPPFVPRLEKTCFLVICKDGADSAEPRATHLKGHLDHVEKHWTRYVTAGPIREPGGDALVGSVFLVLADDLADAQALMEGDPYITCGMYQTITYNEFSNSIGQYIGGKIWESAAAIAHRAAGGPAEDLSKGLNA
ncbi:MAG: YciI family protein [Pseudomonadota bacterium]